MKKIFRWIGIIFVALLVTGVILYLVYVRPVLSKMEQTQVINYDKDLTIILGGGGNSGVLVSDSLVVVIDTKMGDAALQLADSVKALAGNRPILVINTHDHTDHSDGNKYYKGQTILAGGNYTKEIWSRDASEETLPTQWLIGKQDVMMGDDTLTILNMDKSVHTESDIFVYLHKRHLLFGGDVILNKQVPALVSAAADPEGYLATFDMLQKQFDIQHVVPGHGPMGGNELIGNFRQYFIDMHTAANDDAKKDQLIAKYNDWTQVPILMSPGATIAVIQKKSLSK